MIEHGYGDGDGYGEGYGNGDGYGDCDGYGNGYGDGNGYGYGFDKKTGQLKKLIVCISPPWPYIRVGCEIHTVDYWRENWRAIARREDVEASQKCVDALLDKAAEILNKNKGDF